MVAEQGVFLIDKSDNISAYDFSRIVANHTFKILPSRIRRAFGGGRRSGTDRGAARVSRDPL